MLLCFLRSCMAGGWLSVQSTVLGIRCQGES